jgi:hypothetical protein
MEFHLAAGGPEDQMTVRIQGEAVGAAAAVDDARGFPDVLKRRQQILFRSVIRKVPAVIDGDEIPDNTCTGPKRGRVLYPPGRGVHVVWLLLRIGSRPLWLQRPLAS